VLRRPDAPRRGEPVIVAEGLTRTFRVLDRSRGLGGALRDLFRTDRREAVAVAGVDFRVAPGEAVALIGPNGAGKSTTVKMLTGILKPTAGRVRVGGLDPWADRARHVRQIGVVFGQRTQLWWDLAVIEAMDLLAAMFDVPPAVAKARIDRFDALLGIGPLLRTPVRQLSLGERMRCELAAALLHEPPVLFLDEPTIGLDVAVKLRLRAFLADLRDAGKTTILLTTHDLADVAALCPRVLLLARGRLLHDGSMDALVARLGGQRTLVLHHRDGTVVRRPFEGPDQVRASLADDVTDLRVEEPSVDELVARFYEA
jgi:ABC-2 type transport system ATP-binding protein